MGVIYPEAAGGVALHHRQPSEGGGRTLICYMSHELNDNLRYFLQHGLFEHPDYDFLFVFNDPDLRVPESAQYGANVTFMNRENIGHDFGGWSAGVLTDNRYQHYARFLFLNASVIGPFVPSGYERPWPELFLSKLTGAVKLVGATINCMNENVPYVSSNLARAFRARIGALFSGCIDLLRRVLNRPKADRVPHVQSMVFGVDRIGLQVLIDSGIFSTTAYVTSKHQAIHSREVRMSQEILRAGWNIASMMQRYEGVDFRDPARSTVRDVGDIHFADWLPRYVSSPTEIVFVKVSRVGVDAHDQAWRDEQWIHKWIAASVPP